MVANPTSPQSIAARYDGMYQRAEFFHYRPWMYRPFVRALVEKAGVGRKATVLDAGCGQGFFSALLADAGCKVTGIDLSPQGIASSAIAYGDKCAFEVGDAFALNERRYDCIFVRAASPYNAPGMSDRNPTDKLLSCLRPNGVLIWCYPNRFRRQGPGASWLHHTWDEAKRHWAAYPGAQLYFTLRAETIPLGRFGLCTPVTFLARVASKLFGIGGELVAIVHI